MGGCPMAGLPLRLLQQPVMPVMPRMAASRPCALLYSRGLFGTLVSRLVREPINWQLIGCEILVTVTTVGKDFSNR